MARQFGNYSPAVPLGITWEDTFELTDDTGAAVDLTGYAVRAQLREDVPSVNPATSVPLVDPVIELTTAAFYATAPTWPVVEAFAVAAPTTGIIALKVPAAKTWLASEDNRKRKLYWDIRLVHVSTGYTIPLVTGKVSFLPATTV